MNNLNTGTLEDQLAEVIKQEKVIRDSRHDLDLVENLNKELEIVLVFDNMYTSHSALGLSQAWDGLLQMCGRLQRSLQSQIDARSRTGIPEERLQEWKEGFNHFDKVNLKKKILFLKKCSLGPNWTFGLHRSQIFIPFAWYRISSKRR